MHSLVSIRVIKTASALLCPVDTGLCLFQTQPGASAIICYLSYGRRGRNSAQRLDSYGFSKWKDRPFQDYSFTLLQCIFHELDTCVQWRSFIGRVVLSVLSVRFLDNASTQHRSVCFLDLLYLAVKSEMYFMSLPIIRRWMSWAARCFTRSAKNKKYFSFTSINTPASEI